MPPVVTFDLWQTLIADAPEHEDRRSALRREAMRRALLVGGHEVTHEALEHAYRGVMDSYNEVWATERDLTLEEQIELLLRRLDGAIAGPVIPEVHQALARVFHDVIGSVPPLPLEGAVAVLGELKESGYRLGLICNTGRTPGSALRPLLEEMGILPLLDVVSFSNEVGWRKPNARIFKETLRQLGAGPHEAVHIGDNAWTDVYGARSAGMRAVLFSAYHPGQVPGWMAYDAPPPDFQDWTEPDAHIKALAELPPVLRGLNPPG